MQTRPFSNFPYPDAPRYIVQGTIQAETIDGETIWCDTIYVFAFSADAIKKADEMRAKQGGQWRVAINKMFDKTNV